MRAFVMPAYIASCHLRTLAACFCLFANILHGQTLATAPPAFEVATIKPMDPDGGGLLGFLSYPGGKVVIGAETLKIMLCYALDIQDYQITGGPDWVSKDRYNVAALPPASSPSRTAKAPPMKATPSEEQRMMILSLLVSRFGLKYHREVKEGPVYFLTLGSGKLQMQDAKDKDLDPRGGVMRRGDVISGEAFGTNIDMVFWARSISRNLNRPVLDRTNLTGSYDFYLEPSDPTNHDVETAIFDATSRLGLKLKAGKGPVETIVIDSVTRPTEN
jgi:uncharacterized protein (TIGR03435 family)